MVYDYYNGTGFKETRINMMRLKTKGNILWYETNFKINENNIEKMTKTGRNRWKIEKKGFNRYGI